MTFEQRAGYAVLSVCMELKRDELREMAPEERRLFCRDMEAAANLFFGKETGKFFNEIAGSTEPQKADEKELGRRIMAKRNPNYRAPEPD